MSNERIVRRYVGSDPEGVEHFFEHLNQYHRGQHAHVDVLNHDTTFVEVSFEEARLEQVIQRNAEHYGLRPQL